MQVSSRHCLRKSLQWLSITPGIRSNLWTLVSGPRPVGPPWLSGCPSHLSVCSTVVFSSLDISSSSCYLFPLLGMVSPVFTFKGPSCVSGPKCHLFSEPYLSLMSPRHLSALILSFNLILAVSFTVRPSPLRSVLAHPRNWAHLC